MKKKDPKSVHRYPYSCFSFDSTQGLFSTPVTRLLPRIAFSNSTLLRTPSPTCVYVEIITKTETGVVG